MLKLSKKHAAIVIGVLIVISGAAFFVVKVLNQPQTFEECVLKNVKGEETDEAVRAIEDACMQLSIAAGPPEDVCRDLNNSELENLEFSLYSRENEYEKKQEFQLRLYNGNKGITIESLLLEMNTKEFSKPRQYEMLSYLDKAGPKSEGIYTAEVGSIIKGKITRKLVSAKTCENR